MPRKTATPDTHATPLGTYLVEARERINMSRREAARRAGISESRYRQVELGYQQVSPDIRVPVSPKAETVVSMAQAVEADPAEALRLNGMDPATYSRLLVPAADQVPDYEWFARLDREGREKVLADLQRLHLDAELQNRKTG